MKQVGFQIPNPPATSSYVRLRSSSLLTTRINYPVRSHGILGSTFVSRHDVRRNKAMCRSRRMLSPGRGHVKKQQDAHESIGDIISYDSDLAITHDCLVVGVSYCLHMRSQFEQNRNKTKSHRIEYRKQSSRPYM